MDICNAVIRVRLGLLHNLYDRVVVPAPEGSGRHIRRALRIGIVHPLNLCRTHYRDTGIIHNEVRRLHRLALIHPRTNEGYIAVIQRINCISQRHLAEIIDMIVRQTHNIHTHILVKAREFRTASEGVGLSLNWYTPVSEGKLIVYHEYVRRAHEIKRLCIKG